MRFVLRLTCFTNSFRIAILAEQVERKSTGRPGPGPCGYNLALLRHMGADCRVRLNNPGILAWAREEIGVSVPEVAARFKKHAVTIQAWEKGSEFPTFRQLEELANYYKRPVAIFFLPSPPPKSTKPRDFRTLPGVKSGIFTKDTLLAYREVAEGLSNARSLLTDLELDIAFSLPIWSTGDDPEPKAEQLRSLLGISIEDQIRHFRNSSAALDTWRDRLFDFGVIVRICDMPIRDARGFCLFGHGLAGVGLSNQDREHARIFSLFHEVCHLSLKRPGISGIMTGSKPSNRAIEQYCDRFAASFLLPASHPEVVSSLEMFHEGSTIDHAEIAALVSSKFKVSKYVAIRRALDLGILSAPVYWKIVNEWRDIDVQYAAKHRRKGGNYVATQVSHVGKRFVALVMHALQQGDLTPLEGKRILGLDPSSL